MLKIRRFKRRVAVHRGGEIVYYAAPAAAAHLLDAGLAIIKSRHAKIIVEVELTDSATGLCGVRRADQLGLHAGSFGIRTEPLPSGLQCYSHRNHWAMVDPIACAV